MVTAGLPSSMLAVVWPSTVVACEFYQIDENSMVACESPLRTGAIGATVKRSPNTPLPTRLAHKILLPMSRGT